MLSSYLVVMSKFTCDQPRSQYFTLLLWPSLISSGPSNSIDLIATLSINWFLVRHHVYLWFTESRVPVQKSINTDHHCSGFGHEMGFIVNCWMKELTRPHTQKVRMLWAKVSNKSKWYFTAQKGAEETEDFLANCPNLKHFTCLALSTPTPSTIDLHSADCRRDHSLSWISLRSTDRSFVRLSIYSFVLTRAAAATTAVSPHVYKACLWAVIMRSTHLTMLA